MRIGVQLPEVERDVSWSELRDIAVTAEDCDFDSIWVGDHLLYRDARGSVKGPWEAWSVLAGLAEATERVQLGPLVAATSFHSPAMLAKKAATVDEISGGRLILGLGAGWNRAEYEAYGFPYDHRVSRFEEAFTIITSLIREGSVDFAGRFYTHRDLELVPRARANMALMVGSNGPRMLRIAAPQIDLWNTWHAWYGNNAMGLQPLISALEDACRDVGRDPATIERTASAYVQLSRGQGRVSGEEDRHIAAPIKGSHEAIASALHDLGEAGIGHIQLVLDPIDSAAVEEMAEVVALL